MGRKPKVKEEVKVEPIQSVDVEDDIEVSKLRSIAGLTELMHLIQTGKNVYQSSDFINKVVITEDEINKLEFGKLRKMLKDNKLYRY